MQTYPATCSIQVMLAAPGMHMRPAAMLAQIAQQFEADVTVQHNHKKANCKSLLDIVMLGIRAGTQFTVFAKGQDAHKAVRSIKNYFNRLFLDQTAAVIPEDSQSRGKAEHDTEATEMRQKTKPKKKSQNFIWLLNSDAEAVYLAGDFNNWTPTSMARLDGCFQTVVELWPGEHQYKFVVDGQWRNDPAAVKSVANVFGTTNSVIQVS